MKVEILKKKVESILGIYIDSHVRFWEDSYINGVKDNPEKPRMPCVEWDKERVEYRWRPVIDPDLGIIANWEKGVIAKVNYKVCDEFSCIIDLEDDQLYYEGYVPRFMSPEEENFGDYITMNILEDGTIQGWNSMYLKKFIQTEIKNKVLNEQL